MKKFSFSIVLLLLILSFGCSSLAEPTVITKTDDDKIEWAFTQAKQKPEKLLIDVINSAHESLDIAIYSLTHPDIVAAIRDAKKRGVSVRLISDKQQVGGKSQTSALKILGSAGIPTKINSHSGLMHHKMTIADKKIVTTGSFNYSKAASTSNDEVLMVIRDENMAKAFTEQFENMWNDTNKFQSVEYRIAQSEETITESEGTPAKVSSASSNSESNSESCEKPTIKGNKNSMVYHVPGGQSYEQTTANVEMFCTEQEAEEAGYRKSQK